MPVTPRASRKSALDAPVPDRAAIEAYFAAVPADRRERALSEAQEMIYEAWEKQTSHSRKVRAHKAIAVSPLCADAYSLLASETMGRVERRDLYALAVAAAELALGPEAFEEFKGHFWGFLETRPYMRARQGLALAFAEMGDEPAAVGHLRAMLELNPGDNQGNRYLLLRSLLRLNDLEALQRLFAEYPDDGGVDWVYTQLLIFYRQGQGSQPATRKRLKAAVAINRHVPALLCGQARPVFSYGGYVTVGGEDEATVYSIHHGRFWRDTPGAIEWLVSEIVSSGPRKGPPRKGLH